MKMKAGHFNFDIKSLAPRYIQNHQAHRASQGREAQSSKNIQLVLSTILAPFVELSRLCDGLMGLMHLCLGCWIGMYPDNSAFLPNGRIRFGFVHTSIEPNPVK